MDNSETLTTVGHNTNKEKINTIQKIKKMRNTDHPQTKDEPMYSPRVSSS
jgi:hypothetical protein